jgi:flagellar hook-associated protein 2
MADSISPTSSATTASTSTARTSALFQVGGLASGIDTNAIVDAIIAADSVQLNALKQKQSDYQVQISTLGTLVSQLQALQTASANLASSGVVSIRPTATYADFTTSGSARAEGNYNIQVNDVARAAKMRSTSFTSAQDTGVIPSGTLQFSIDGTATASISTGGKTLADIAEAINQNISGLTASVISTSSGYYLNVARSSTGYSTTAEAALTVVSDPGLGLTLQQSAQNASLTVDDLVVSRQSNTITDIIPGITLNLTGDSGVSNSVDFAADSSGTQEALTTFVEAYNDLAKTLKGQMVLDSTAQYGDTLLSHATTSTIERAMQGLLSQVVVPSGKVRTLADLGLEIQRDGTVLLNEATLTNAVQTSPSSVNAVFTTATTGIAATIKSLVQNQTNKVSGTLVLQQGSLESTIDSLSEQEERAQAYLDAERARLVAQFTAMETLISGFNAASTYLNQIANLKISK